MAENVLRYCFSPWRKLRSRGGLLDLQDCCWFGPIQQQCFPSVATANNIPMSPFRSSWKRLLYIYTGFMQAISSKMNIYFGNTNFKCITTLNEQKCSNHKFNKIDIILLPLPSKPI